MPAFPLWPEVAEEAAEGGQAKPRLCTTSRLGSEGGWGEAGATARAEARMAAGGQRAGGGLCLLQGRTWLGEAARRWRRENFLSEQRF